MLKQNQGLERFIQEFKEYKDSFVIIGGLASSMNMANYHLEFRKTKDFDLVVFVKEGNEPFFVALRDFLKEGAYDFGKQGNYYRFTNPKDNTYPFMIEILSRVDLTTNETLNTGKFRIKIDEEFLSLSAIMLDDDIYKLILQQHINVFGLCIADPYALIVMKVRAWRDLTEKRNRGDKIRSKDINKHRKDVIRLSRIIDETRKIDLSPRLKEDVRIYLESCEIDDHSFHQLAPDIESFKVLRELFFKIFQL
jgi:hypothetical protein